MEQGIVPNFAVEVLVEVTAEITVEAAAEITVEVLAEVVGRTELESNYNSGNP